MKDTYMKMIYNLKKEVDELKAKLNGENPKIKKLEPYVYLLKQSSPTIIIPKDFFLISIRRNNDTDYDTNTITEANYENSLLHIEIGGEPLMNIPVDVAMFPWKYVDLEHPFRLEKPFFIKAGTKITLQGASGLSDLTFALHGYHAKIKGDYSTKVYPFFAVIRIDGDDDRGIYVVPDEYEFYATRIYYFQRKVQGSYVNYEDVSTASSIASANFTYYGYQQFLPQKLNPALWTGTREKPYTFPAPIKCPSGTNIMVEQDTASNYYRWFIFVGYKKYK